MARCVKITPSHANYSKLNKMTPIIKIIQILICHWNVFLLTVAMKQMWLNLKESTICYVAL